MFVLAGPFKLNQVPLRRINAAYVIATQTKVDISNVKTPEHINDEYFRRINLKERRGQKSDIFKDGNQVWWSVSVLRLCI